MDEIPFEIPDSWAWVRLKNVCNLTAGKTPSKKELQETGLVPYFTVADMNNPTNLLFLQESRFFLQKPVTTFPKNSIVFPKNGGAIFTNKKRILKQDSLVDLNTGVMILFVKDILPYVFQWLLGIDFGKCYKGTALPTLDYNKMKDFLVPLPPLNEQLRIVKQIELLVPYIKDYDKVERELTTLNETFPGQIKKSILQYAIQGKLVPQDPNEEPASVLLEKIKAEKQKLIKAGKIKKDKQESYIYKRDNRHYEKIGDKEVDITDKIPFEIPPSWAWVRLENIALINPKNECKDRLLTSFIPMNLLKGGYCNTYQYECQLWEEIKKGFTHFAQKDIVVAKITPCFQNRKSAILYKLQGELGAGTTELHVVRSLQPLAPEYVFWIFKTKHFITQGIKNFTGTAGQQRISSSFIKNYLIPLPPQKEQQRIVQKIEQLFKILS